MTAPPDDAQILSILQRYLERLGDDVSALLVAVADARTPDAARRSLVGGLNYVLERFDLFPDHIKGLGLLDDAAVLRISARHAVSSGCDDAGVRRIAAEEVELDCIFGELAGPLEEYVSRLPWVQVRGRSAADIVADQEKRAAFWKDLNYELRNLKPEPLDASCDVPTMLKELRKMVRHGLIKAGVLKG